VIGTEHEWQEAEKHVKGILNLYMQLPVGNAWFALGNINKLLGRYQQGERNEKLLKEMQEVE
jgi:hypothetical protein